MSDAELRERVAAWLKIAMLDTSFSDKETVSAVLGISPDELIDIGQSIIDDGAKAERDE